MAFDCDPLQVSVKGLLRHEMGRGGMGRGGVGSGGWGWFGGVGWDRVVWGVGGVGGGLDWVGWGGVTPPVHTSWSHAHHLQSDSAHPAHSIPSHPHLLMRTAHCTHSAGLTLVLRGPLSIAGPARVRIAPVTGALGEEWLGEGVPPKYLC